MYIQTKGNSTTDAEETVVKGKRMINVASIWIIVIFTVIAVMLSGIFMLVYSSIQNQEANSTLREEASILSDNADYQIMTPMRTEPVRRLSAKEGMTETVQSVSLKGEADSTEIKKMSEWCASACAAIPTCDRVLLYFPEARMAVGSDGVHFIADKKYTVKKSAYSFLLNVEPEDMVWLRQPLAESGEEIPYIVYAGPLPGIFPEGKTPMIVSAVKEEKLHTLLQRSLRTLGESDQVFLADVQGVIWSAADTSLVGVPLPNAQNGDHSWHMQDGREALLAESSSAASGFIYVLARPNAGRLRNYNNTLTLVAVICFVLLCAGMIAVLWVQITHYSRPMRQLIRHIDIPEDEKSGGSLVTSPIEHFSRIETALQDMSKIRTQQAQFLQKNQRTLRDAWLNCLMYGEAQYTGPMPQLGIDFTYPHFQVVIMSNVPSPETEKSVLACFPDKYKIIAFTSREKERVLLINHGMDADAVPGILMKASKILDEKHIPLAFGVGVMVDTENRVQVSFRCARRALSNRYFGEAGRVSVFEAKETPRGEAELTQLISRFNSLTSMIRRQSADEANEEIDAIVAQLKENTPYLNIVRSVMLTAAMFLCKIVYDMKSNPEDVFGDDLMNTYYHLEDISAFSTRLKEDSMTLIAYLSRESSEGNRSVVEYAILHIRNTPPAELSTQSIADALSISTGHLSRVFHQETGKKLVDYLQEVRMEHAARLIRENELTNEEICAAIGYSRLQYFSTKFKEYYGVTLNEYRRRNSAGQDEPAAGNAAK